MKAQMTWHRGMHFSCLNEAHTTEIDATPIHGGSDKGPTPKELILDAMMGCTAMDVVSILSKMRQEISGFQMEIEAVQTTAYPTHFKSATLIYHLEGKIDSEKAKKAVEASMTKYCGVNYMISKTCDISYLIKVNGQEVVRAKADFIEPIA